VADLVQGGRGKKSLGFRYVYISTPQFFFTPFVVLDSRFVLDRYSIGSNLWLVAAAGVFVNPFT
jgi:hypothetical protein